MIALRDYQIDAENAVRAAMGKHKAVLLHANSREYGIINFGREKSRLLLGGSFQVSLWGVSAGTCRSANTRERERHAKGFFSHIRMTAKARIIEFNGEQKSIRQWARSSGITYRTLLSRLKRNWAFEKAISEKPIIGRNQSFDKEPRSPDEIARGHREAVARWRKRHPEKNRASQKKQDIKPERKAAKRLRAAEKGKTQEYKEKAKAYKSKPEAVKKRRERSKTLKFRCYQRAWRKLPHARAYGRAAKKRERETPIGLLNNRMRAAVRRGIERSKSKTLPEKLGYTIQQLMTHIEKQFLKGMSWENSSDWHIDHIIPLSHFKFSSEDDPEFKEAWSLSNLRPLWAKDNLAKNNKVTTLL